MATILVVEDRPIDRKLLATVLKSGGHDTVEAFDGEEALKLLRWIRPHLVISDILMPTVDGYELVRRMREIPEVASTPVLFYTATYHEREARTLARRCGVVDVLTKPSPPQTILDTVDAALAGRPRQASPPPDRTTFDQEHVRVMSSTLATKTAESEVGQQRMAAIVEVAHQIAAERDPLILLKKVCDEARHVTLAQYAVIGLLDEKGTATRALITSGLDGRTIARTHLPPPSSIIMDTVVGQRRALRARNPKGRPDAIGLPDHFPPPVSALHVPIASSSRAYGWLGLFSKLGAEEFAQSDEQVAATLGTHAGIAYENIALYDDLRRYAFGLQERNQLVAVGSELGLALIERGTIPDMLGRCAEVMVRHVDAAFARIWTLSVDGRMLELQASAGLYTHLDGPHSRVPVGAYKIGRIAEQRRPLFSSNVVEDPFVSDHEWARREGMVSFAGYPLIVDDRLVGVMAMFGRAQFSDETLETMGSVSRQIAVGIERKRVEDQLRSNEERTRFALGVARMGVWEVDLVTDRLAWSETMPAVFGLQAEDAPTTRQAFIELMHPEDRALVESAMRRATTGGDFTVEFRVVWADGSTHWVHGRAAIVPDANGRPAYLRGVVMDISDQKLLEEQFRQVQKMEAVGQLAGGVAHDFNNLLTAIIGYADLIADQLDPSSVIQTDIEEIRKAGERAAGLTRQLLAFSRKQVLQPCLVNLSTLVDGTSHMLRRLIGEQITVALVLAPDLAPVRADAGQIEQILMNLAVNARDAMPMGGQLSIETANVQLDDSYPFLERQGVVEQGPYVMLAVSDSGVGMNAETQRRLFEPFFTTKERGKGTGLGLATVQTIVKQSNGYVWVYSELGRGTTFKVFLPRAEGPTDPTRVVTARTPAVGSETVLLVEDEDAVRSLSRVMLERAGYRVWDAADPIQAQALFARMGPSIDLLVTDVILPGLTGPALFQRLSSERLDLKVLYVSGYTDTALGQSGELDPGQFFLQKPFTFDGLTRKVREALDR